MNMNMNMNMNSLKPDWLLFTIFTSSSSSVEIYSHHHIVVFSMCVWTI